jgi:phospholipid transport system substrate-binding protein
MLKSSRKYVVVTTICQLIGGAFCSLAVASPSGLDNGEFAAADGSSPANDKAAEFVRGKHQELQGALKASKEPKSDPKLLAIFDAMLDYDALTRDSLGSDWEALTPDQRTEFGGILKQLIQKSYRKNLSDTSGYEVQYTGVDEGADGAVVKTLAQNKANKREKPLGINYVVSTTAAGLKVRDVVTDEVSLVANYRSQFKRVIKKKGFPGLVEQMRKQLDK